MIEPGTAMVIGAAITAVPASLAAYASISVARRTKTNHGKNIGQHVEHQGEQLSQLLRWADFHQESDNEVREALGLEGASFPLDVRDDAREG